MVRMCIIDQNSSCSFDDMRFAKIWIQLLKNCFRQTSRSCQQTSLLSWKQSDRSLKITITIFKSTLLESLDAAFPVQGLLF